MGNASPTKKSVPTQNKSDILKYLDDKKIKVSDEVRDIIDLCELNFADVKLTALNSNGPIAKIVQSAYDGGGDTLEKKFIKISLSFSDIADNDKEKFDADSREFIKNIYINIPGTQTKAKNYIGGIHSHSAYVEHFAHIWAICKYHKHNPTEAFRPCRGCGGLKSTVANTR
jgi:hypothetical protein